MRTIVHLSDLHFGRVDNALLAPLTALVNRLQPDVVVVSGDLTQRARTLQFQQARAFLDGLPAPQIVVPGNHDIPLHHLFNRFLRPLDKYRRLVTEDLAPSFIDDEIAIVGINTARSMTFKNGRINTAQIAQVQQRFDGLDAGITKIVVTHHPFDLPANFDSKHLVGRAPQAMQAWSNAGADLFLAGHLHASVTASTTARYPIDRYAALVVQAGTATSTRGRGEVNSFNVLRIASTRIEVERWRWNGSGDFEHDVTESFARHANQWSATDAVSAQDGDVPDA
ncbi:3',5'-cyclic AMP phosphodiesterase CpdA [Actimicrobium sp. GrIS 1.19]|uniref:metallophosphoesterase family protein n=1 Tax=Actimicrobium sp. GrIS 1.19 TaxID=3071708 RepID=UPI002DFBEC82|nr:3',5'-cyclic AMP phosphodiesterase CpdA [Actimicrobium sp. GrIS 1.19]